jgi:predicted CXXCH cytochrome family protein
VASGSKLCFKCHEAERPSFGRALVHAPVKGDRECLACHNPHVAAGARLTRKPKQQLCFQCHDAKLFQGKVVHKALEQGCAKCHNPHSSDNPRLLTLPQPDLCTQCHRDMSKHLHTTSGRGKDPRTGKPLQCTGCHRPHASEQEHLLTHEPTRELCVQCHDPSMETTHQKK